MSWNILTYQPLRRAPRRYLRFGSCYNGLETRLCTCHIYAMWPRGNCIPASILGDQVSERRVWLIGNGNGNGDGGTSHHRNCFSSSSIPSPSPSPRRRRARGGPCTRPLSSRPWRRRCWWTWSDNCSWRRRWAPCPFAAPPPSERVGRPPWRKVDIRSQDSSHASVKGACGVVRQNLTRTS